MKLAKTSQTFLKVLFLVLLLVNCHVSNNKDLAKNTSGFKFEISFQENVVGEVEEFGLRVPITGRVYVIISRNKDREPRFQVRGARSVPIWGKDVFSLKHGEAAIIDEEVLGYPLRSTKDIPPGEYYVQGFVNIYTEFKRSDGHTLWMHKDQWEGQRWNVSPGNIYSDVEKITIDPSKKEAIKISCNNVIPPIEVPPDTNWVKRIKFQSKILTEFWGQPMYLGAKILLPKDYDTHPDVYYPVEYIQDHFNHEAPHTFRSTDPGEGNRHEKYGYESYKLWTSEERQPRMISVRVQHPCPYYDDSYGVISANVGPYGDALMKELYPFIEENFRVIREPWARVNEGGSTGGWTCLAQQIFYPDFYGGVFCLCPDPIDFRAYTSVDIYEDENAYYNEYEWISIPRPETRSVLGEITATVEQVNHQELALGTNSRSGQQWDIWQAVYSPVGEDGYPKPIFDKMTGKIDRSVAEYWRENYDLRYILERDWEEIGPKLVGKIHIYCGDMDSYYLNNAVYLMEQFLEGTKNPYYEGVVKYYDRMPHCWGPWGAELIKLVGEHFEKNAPIGEKKKWIY
jgi:hypothetical protein